MLESNLEIRSPSTFIIPLNRLQNNQLLYSHEKTDQIFFSFMKK